MNKRPILVAFSNQKGGVGKSTVTAVLASYFNYVKGLKVAVVDCDYPQFSLEKLRGRDLKNLEKSEYHQRLFCRQCEDGSSKAYPIITSTPEAAAEIPGKLEGDYDLIFFDLPGTVNSRGVFESVMNMDFIFTPIVKDCMVMQSSLSLSDRDCFPVCAVLRLFPHHSHCGIRHSYSSGMFRRSSGNRLHISIGLSCLIGFEGSTLF